MKNRIVLRYFPNAFPIKVRHFRFCSVTLDLGKIRNRVAVLLLVNIRAEAAERKAVVYLYNIRGVKVSAEACRIAARSGYRAQNRAVLYDIFIFLICGAAQKSACILRSGFYCNAFGNIAL